jgi:hypothetical protein
MTTPVSAMRVSTALTSGSPVLAHGIGGRQDLPIPFTFLLAGAGAAVLVSFGVLVVDRLDSDPMRAARSPHLYSDWRIIG